MAALAGSVRAKAGAEQACRRLCPAGNHRLDLALGSYLLSSALSTQFPHHDGRTEPNWEGESKETLQTKALVPRRGFACFGGRDVELFEEETPGLATCD